MIQIFSWMFKPCFTLFSRNNKCGKEDSSLDATNIAISNRNTVKRTSQFTFEEKFSKKLKKKREKRIRKLSYSSYNETTHLSSSLITSVATQNSKVNNYHLESTTTTLASRLNCSTRKFILFKNRRIYFFTKMDDVGQKRKYSPSLASSEYSKQPKKSFSFSSLFRRKKNELDQSVSSSSTWKTMNDSQDSPSLLSFPHFFHDPESPFDISPFREGLFSRLSHLVKSELVMSNVPFPDLPLSLPNQEQSIIASGYLHLGLQMQENNNVQGALVNVSAAAELGVPLALYWLATSSRYGWGRFVNPKESFSCFVLSAYLSVLASVEEEKLNQLPSFITPSSTEKNPESGRSKTWTKSYGGPINSAVQESIQMNLGSGHRRITTSIAQMNDLHLAESNKFNTISPSSPPSPRRSSLPNLTERERALSFTNHRDPSIPNLTNENTRTTNSPVSTLRPFAEIPPANLINLYDPNELGLMLAEIGSCFEFGIGPPRDYTSAAYFYELAAGLGDADAAVEIADCYRHGHGVGRDKFRAAAYYRVAEKSGINMVNCTWIHKAKWGGTIEKNQKSKTKKSSIDISSSSSPKISK